MALAGAATRDKPAHEMTRNRIAYIEPYCGGSHGQLIEVLQRYFPGDAFTMPAKKWHWRSRAAALTFSQLLPPGDGYKTVFVSSMLNFSELLALRPDWARIPRKIVYFHENQFEYPKQYDDKEDRDYYFLHASVCSALVADVVAWNSRFNMDSFLNGIPKLNAMLPVESECKPSTNTIRGQILAKSMVIHVPINLPPIIPPDSIPLDPKPIFIGWPHRWEHDKNPSEFLRILNRLAVEAKVDFRVLVFGGESYEGTSIRDEILKAVEGEESRIQHCGRIADRREYLTKLRECDVVVSTAVHEFFGVAMVEAARLGCKCLCPKRLAYPELFREESLYTTESKLYKALRELCVKTDWVRRNRPFDDLIPGVWEKLDMDILAKKEYEVLLKGKLNDD